MTSGFASALLRDCLDQLVSANPEWREWYETHPDAVRDAFLYARDIHRIGLQCRELGI